MTVSSCISRPLMLLLSVGAMGCASTKALQTESSPAAIRSAEELGASAIPQAALHLQYAEEQLEAAAALNASGDVAEANSLLLRAEADAELAVALSRADAEKSEAE